MSDKSIASEKEIEEEPHFSYTRTFQLAQPISIVCPCSKFTVYFTFILRLLERIQEAL
jgi:hypothetical protein